jgi:hypothetical protein
VSAYAGTLTSGTGTTFAADATPAAPGDGFYFVVRDAGEFCNDIGLWTSGGSAESPSRETSLP